eukprot:888964-Prorocentrum_minimum.AAC.4
MIYYEGRFIISRRDITHDEQSPRQHTNTVTVGGHAGGCRWKEWNHGVFLVLFTLPTGLALQRVIVGPYPVEECDDGVLAQGTA